MELSALRSSILEFVRPHRRPLREHLTPCRCLSKTLSRFCKVVRSVDNTLVSLTCDVPSRFPETERFIYYQQNTLSRCTLGCVVGSNGNAKRREIDDLRHLDELNTRSR